MLAKKSLFIIFVLLLLCPFVAAGAAYADTIAEVSGNNQTGTVGQTLANPFIVKITDGLGDPVQGVEVTFTVTNGGGSLSNTQQTTNVNGEAQTTLTLGTAAGTDNNTVEAAASGVDGSPVIFTASADPGPLASLTITPHSVSLTADETQQFTATGEDSYGNSVTDLGTLTWSVNGGIGTIDNTGLFDATTVGTGSVTVTSSIDSVTDDSETITITPGVLTVLTVSPDTASLSADDTQQFSATGEDADGNAVTELGTLTWSVNGAIGTIDNTGLFDATTVGIGSITVTSSIDSVTDTSGNVTVMPGVLTTLTVSPDTVSLSADDTQQFSATGEDADGNAVTDLGTVTWSVNGGIGTIDNTGLFDATTVGTGSVTVTSSIDSVTDTSGTVTVTPGVLAVLTISPDTATLTADDTQQFTATGEDSDGNAVTALGTLTWSVNGGIGAIDNTGLFDATTVGTGSVTVTSTIGSVTDTSGTITITPGVLAVLTVSPDTASLTADDTQQFTASGEDSDGNAVTALGTLTWSVNGGIGSIDNTGLFDATTVGTGSVTVTSSINSVTDDSETITVTPGVLATLTVSPDTVSLSADDSQQFSATGEDSDGNAVTAIGTLTWSVNGGIGTIDNTGLFDATTVGTGSVTVTSTIGSVTDTSGTITITPGVLDALTVSPDSVSLSADDSQQFSATGEDSDGNAVTAIGTLTWSVNGGIGTIDNTGLFDATTVGTGSVTVTSSIDSVTDTSGDIIVNAGVLTSLTINPQTATLSADETLQFTVAGADGDGNSVTDLGTLTWSVNGGIGTIENTGLFDATTAGIGSVSVTSSINGVTDTTVDITVTPGILASLSVSPDTATLTADDQQQFSATGFDADGNEVADVGTLTWSVSGGIGIIDNNGLFDATTVGTGSVSVTSSINSVFDTSGDITVTPGVLAALTISPDAVTLTADDTQQFSASGADSDDNEVTDLGTLAWSVNGGIGSIDSTGLFDATTAGTGSITVVSSINGVTDTSGEITVTPGQVNVNQSLVTVDPDSISADGVATATITVTPRDADGNDLGVGETVALTTTSGTLLGSVVDVGDGTYIQQLQATTLAGTATITATVNSTTLTSQPTVTFVDDIIPSVNSFSVADADSGSSLYTNDRTVNVAMDESDIGGSVAFWLITESGTQPSQAEFQSANITARPSSYTISGAEGLVNLYAWVMDDHNNISAISSNSQSSIELDLTPPAIAISSPSDGAVLYPATQTVSGTVSDPSISTGTLSLNGDIRAISFSGGSFTESVVLDKGANTIGVLATDLAGNEGSTFITVMNDHDGDGIGDDIDTDDDNDGLPDTWEEAKGLDPYLNDATDDPDRDDLTNEEEFAKDTHPMATDTDGDTIGDGTEVAMATEPLDPGSFPEISLGTSHLWITDVTPTSFSVVWISNQPAACFANIFSDPDGNDIIFGLDPTDKSVEHPPASDNGVMQVNISGLQPNTDYYFRIVTISNEGVLVEPANGDPLHKVRTEDSAEHIPFNDVLAHKVLKSDGTTPALGALLLAEVEGGSHPVTGWVGEDTTDQKYALVDLNNLYNETTHIGLELVGGETITLVSVGGYMGFRNYTGEVPPVTGGSSILTLDPEPDDEFCTLDSAGPVVNTGTLQPADGTFVNDNTPLISASYSDLYSEVDPGSVRLMVDNEDVTDEATVNSSGIQFTPNPLLGDGSHSVTLTLADEWGNEADPFTWSFSVDATDPVVTITEPVDGDYLYPATQTVRWSIDEENLTEVTCTLNGTSHTIPLGVFENTVDLAEGLNVIEVGALDIAGNTASTTVQVTLDQDFDGDGQGNHYDLDDDNDLMPDIWEDTYGFNLFDPYDAYRDSDGDGYANVTEYTGGESNPLDYGSVPNITFTVDHLTVTDVTTEGFSVVWHASEASICRLVAYDDLGIPLSSTAITSDSELHPPAEDNGVMKVTVNGLDANSTYQFQTVTTSNTTGVVLVSPVYSQALEVTTEVAVSAVQNDPIKQRIYDEDGNPADGALLVVLVEGAKYPVTGWVGEDLASPWAQGNLNNLYSEENGEPLALSGGEELTVWSFGGSLGNYVNIQKIGAPTGTAQTALAEDAYLDTRLGYYRDLEIDLNIAGVAVYSNPGFTSYSLLEYLADQAGSDPTAIQSIRRYNSGTGSWETASWFSGQAAGVDFPIKPGEACLIYMSRGVDDVWFEGMALGAAVDLLPGLNLTSLPAGKQNALPYSSYQMLQSLGDENEVASVKRYDSSGVWQTTSWFGDPAVPTAVNFSTSEKEGYLIYMKQAKEQWRPY